MRKTDGVITFDAAEYSPETTEAVKAWFAETSRKAYYAGPLIPCAAEIVSNDARAHQFKLFLDDKVKSHGEKSVIYVGASNFSSWNPDILLILKSHFTDLLWFALLAY